MPGNNSPIINTVCDRPFSEIAELAKREGKAVSSVALDLIREALELREDTAPEWMANKRAKTFNHQHALTVEQAF